jgi:hypothetical protein
VGIQGTGNFFSLIQVSQIQNGPLEEVAIFLFPLIELIVNFEVLSKNHIALERFPKSSQLVKSLPLL